MNRETEELRRKILDHEIAELYAYVDRISHVIHCSSTLAGNRRRFKRKLLEATERIKELCEN